MWKLPPAASDYSWTRVHTACRRRTSQPVPGLCPASALRTRGHCLLSCVCVSLRSVGSRQARRTCVHPDVCRGELCTREILPHRQAEQIREVSGSPEATWERPLARTNSRRKDPEPRRPEPTRPAPAASTHASDEDPADEPEEDTGVAARPGPATPRRLPIKDHQDHQEQDHLKNKTQPSSDANQPSSGEEAVDDGIDRPTGVIYVSTQQRSCASPHPVSKGHSRASTE